MASNLSLNTSECSLRPTYFEWEPIYYLAIMCPIAIIGLFSNVITFRIFLDKNFNSVTFKYLKLITIIDFLICLTVIPYCLTSYTQAFNYYDLFLRNIYLAYIYLPMANLLITLSMYLNLLVTIERLISVGWPTKKYILFKPSRYYISCVCVVLLSVLFNLCLFFLFEAKFCYSSIVPSDFFSKMKAFLDVYQIFKEIITRVLPLIILIISNVILICIVKKSRKKMRKNRDKNHKKEMKSKCSFITSLCQAKKQPTKRVTNKRKVNQDNQLTLMTIFVAILYTATTIPMVFAFPGLIFQNTQSTVYKTYAAWSNILELIQCSFRFIIYICFTTQFRLAVVKMFTFKTESSKSDRCEKTFIKDKDDKENVELLVVHQI